MLFLIEFFLIHTSSDPIYSFSGDTAIIKGTGIIDSAGIKTLGNYQTLTLVIIEDGITHIGDLAFEPCACMKKVVMAKSILSIGSGIFYNCRKLEYIEVNPQNNYFVNDSYGALLSSDLRSLYKVPNILTDYQIPSRVERLESMAFQCAKFDHILISKFVNIIGYACFHDFTCNILSFEPNSNLITLTESSFNWCKIKHIIFPKSLQNIKWPFDSSSIDLLEFESPSNLTELPNGFIRSTNFKTIILPSTVKSFVSSFAVDCALLENVTIPRDCTSVSSSAFVNCPKLANIFVESGNLFFKSSEGTLTDIEETQLLFIPPSIQHVSIGDKIRDVSSNALRQCLNLKTLSVSEDNLIYSSSNGMLFNRTGTVLIAVCGGIESIEVPEDVESIEFGAALGCVNLKSVIFKGTNLKVISTEFCKECTNLNSVTFCSSITEISDYAFQKCSSLRQVDLSWPELSTIGRYAFIQSGLERLVINDNVDLVETGSFSRCYSLSTVELYPKTGCIFNTNAFEYSSIKDLVIGSNMKELRQLLFFKCSQLNNITFDGIPSLLTIGESALRGTAIASFTVPKSATQINSLAFAECANLHTIIFDEESPINELVNLIFQGDGLLSKVVWGKNIQKIDPTTFYQCYSLISFDYDGNYLKSRDGILFNLDGTKLVLCPPGKESIEIGQTVKSIEENAFYCCNMRTVTFIDSPISEIPRNTFYGCANLEQILMPDAVRRLGSGAFNKCTKLRSVIFDTDSLIEEIGDDSFSSCSSLQTVEININANLMAIGSSAFKDCSSFQGFDFPLNVSSLGISAFENCNSLTAIFLPNITTVPSSCFAGCSKLAYVSFPQTLTSIESNAFSSTNLDSARIPSLVASIGSNAFGGIPNMKIHFCGISQTNNDIKIADSSVIVYVTHSYSLNTFHDLKVMKVLYPNCDLIPATATASLVFTIGTESCSISAGLVMAEFVLSDDN